MDKAQRLGFSAVRIVPSDGLGAQLRIPALGETVNLMIETELVAEEVKLGGLHK
jgi:hypothetical protein